MNAMLGLAEICVVFFLFLLTLPAAVVILQGAWRMRELKSYRLCMAGAIVAVLPIHLGFLIGLPFGIWALNLLNDPEVKAAFRAKELQMQKKKRAM